MRIEIWSDIVCPWCYIAHGRLDRALSAFEHRDHVEVVHRSFELDPGHDATHTEPVAMFLARRYGPTGPAMDAQVAEQARREGLAYRTERRTGSTLDAHRLLHWAADQGLQNQLLAVLFDANFARAEDIFSPLVLADLVARAGLDPAQARRVLADPGAYLNGVRDDEAAASALGAHGVPYLLIDGHITVPGAQSVAAYRRAIEQGWDHQVPVDDEIQGICLPDGTCAVPSHA